MMAKIASDPNTATWDEQLPVDHWDNNRTASATWHPGRRVYFCGLTLGGRNVAFEEFQHWGQARQFCELYMETGSVTVVVGEASGLSAQERSAEEKGPTSPRSLLTGPL